MKRYLASVSFIALFGVLLSPFASPTWAQDKLTADTFARYQGGPLDDPAPTVVVNPAFAIPVTSSAHSDPSFDGFSFARGDARAVLFASGPELGAFSYASGFDPNFDPPVDVHATASARSVTDWISTSGSLPTNAPINIEIRLPVDGTLAAVQFFAAGLGPTDVFSFASLDVAVNSVSVYDGSALVYDPTPAPGDEVLVESGDWVGEFVGVNVPTTGFGPLPGFEANIFDIVTIPSTLGAIFSVDFLMNTEAFTIGPFEAFTQADFLSTSSYELVAVDPNTGQPVDVQFAPTVPQTTILDELLIDSPPVTLDIAGDVEIAAGAEVGVTPDYQQASATLETILAVTHTGTLTGLFANEGEHLRDGIFVDAIEYNLNEILIALLQAAPGDLNGDRLVDSTDIQLILAANSFGNPNGGPYTWLQGDNNGDGLVDATDIQNILAANLFGQGAYAAQPANAVVPEPSTFVLTALALLGLLAHGHRRRRRL